AERLQALDDGVRDLRVTLDDRGVDLLAEEPLHLLEERLAAAPIVRGRLRVRVDQGQVESSEVELLTEARLAPLGLSGGLRDLAGLPLGHLPGRRGRGHGHSFTQRLNRREPAGSYWPVGYPPKVRRTRPAAQQGFTSRP